MIFFSKVSSYHKIYFFLKNGPINRTVLGLVELAGARGRSTIRTQADALSIAEAS